MTTEKKYFRTEAIDWLTPLTAARWLWVPLALFGVTRLVILLAAYLGALLIPEASSSPPYHLRPPDNILVDVFGSRWDTGFYVSIAEEGYRFEGVPLPSVAFFPLLPLMMRALTPLVGDTLLAGILISNLALLLAMILFYRLVEDTWGESLAGRAVWYLLIFPAAFFGVAIYSESLFLLAAIGALYFARRGYWEIALLFGIAATLTRFVGLIVAPMLLVEWIVQRRTRSGEGRPTYRSFLAPFLVPLGTLAYMAYLGRVFGDPLAFVKAQVAWDRVPRLPWEMLVDILKAPPEGWLAAISAGRVPINDWIDFGMVLLFLVLGLVLLSQRRWSEATFVLASLVVTVGSGLLMSHRRFVWVLFPAFIVLAQWGERPMVDRLVTGLSLVGLAILTAMFANGFWVA